MKAAVVLAVLAIALPARAEGIYGLGVSGQYGNAYLPATAEAGPTTAISYREHAGVLGNMLLFIATAPAKPMAKTSTSYDTECQGSGSARSCTTWKTTTTTTPSDAEVDAWEKAVEEWGATKGAAIMRGEMGQELQLDIMLRQLGGNTTGFNFKLFRPLGGPGSPLWIAPYAWSYLKFHDVTTRKVVSEGGVLRSMDVVSDRTFKYVGMPIRAQGALGETGFGMHLQFDFNVLSLFFDDPSPIRAGVRWAGPHVIVTLEGVISGLRPDGGSLNLEAILAF